MAKKIGQKDVQRSTKHTHKTKDCATQTLLKTEDELRCPGRVSSSWLFDHIFRIMSVKNSKVETDFSVCVAASSIGNQRKYV